MVFLTTKADTSKTNLRVKGDTTSEVTDAQDACIAGGGEWDEETGTCKTAEAKEKEACDAAGGEWDEEAGTCKTEDDTEDETKKAEETCINNGGTWDGSACTYPSTEPEVPTPNPGTTEPTTPVQVQVLTLQQKIQQVMSGLIEETYTISLIDYNNTKCSIEHFFFLLKKQGLFPCI